MASKERAALAVRAAGAVMLAAAIGIVAWLALGHNVPPTATALQLTPGNPAIQPVSAPLPRASPRIPVTVASGATIMAHRGAEFTVFRMAENADIMVLDFATLHDQGEMLNRAAAMIEKRGMPHDRVLTDAELARAIHDSKADPDTFYYGHDYSVAELGHVFAAADRQGVALTAGEKRLRALLLQEHPLALISLTQLDPAHGVDASMRETIYKHERSHGEYFSNPKYAAFAALFWHDTLTAAERAGFRRYLAAEDYDPAIEDLMINESQAYLMHTRDPRFFSPAAAGLTEVELDRLRGLFLVMMPPGWLRDCFTPVGVK